MFGSSKASKDRYLVSSPTRIFLYINQTFGRVLTVDSGANYVRSSSTIAIFLYVNQAVERVLAVDFVSKVR
jgi:hypothetical protein